MIIVQGKPKVSGDLNDKTVLWRYLDAAKYLDFLHNNTLYFSRGDQFEDKYEGSFTQSVKRAIERSYKENKIDFTFDEFKKRLRERVYLNCWHASSDDSMAMWSLYGRSATAVAITTTVKKLRETIANAKLPYNIYISRVRYVKHWRDPELKIRPYSNVFAYKVMAYEFEKEVRVIVDRFHDEFESAVVDEGFVAPVSHKTLLRSVVISPEAPTWYHDLVKEVSSKYGVVAPVRRSKLAFEPV